MASGAAGLSRPLRVAPLRVTNPGLTGAGDAFVAAVAAATRRTPASHSRGQAWRHVELVSAVSCRPDIPRPVIGTGVQSLAGSAAVHGSIDSMHARSWACLQVRGWQGVP